MLALTLKIIVRVKQIKMIKGLFKFDFIPTNGTFLAEKLGLKKE